MQRKSYFLSENFPHKPGCNYPNPDSDIEVLNAYDHYFLLSEREKKIAYTVFWASSKKLRIDWTVNILKLKKGICVHNNGWHIVTFLFYQKSPLEHKEALQGNPKNYIIGAKMGTY